MPKVKISEFDTVAANNTDIDGINLAEGMLPSDVNNAIRELMSQLKDFQTGAGGDSFNGPIGTSTAAAGSFTTLSATGVSTFSAGTVSAPAITTTGDTNTGIFFPAADTIAFTEGGVESMRINSSGNVGINTTTPLQKLDVAGNIAVSAAGVTFYYNADNTNSYFVGGNTGATGGPNAVLRFQQTGVGERMRIDSSGNVGIGTSSPSRPLSVSTTGFAVASFIASGGETNVQIANTGTNGRNWSLVAGGNGGAFNSGQFGIYDSTAAAARIAIDSSGNVGIGTSAPAAKLDILTAASTNFLVGFGANLDNYYTVGASGTHIFRNGLTERMRIDSSGNVGIGASSTSAFFNGTSTAAKVFISYSSTNTSVDDPTPNLALHNPSTTTNNYSSLYFSTVNTSSTLVGTSAILGIHGARDGAWGSGALAFLTTASGTDGPVERMRIDSSGRVTIGTTNTDPFTNNVAGIALGTVTGIGLFCRDSGVVLGVNRKTNDGNLITLGQDGVEEGTISVSGTTVSYNGGHLSRWSQLLDNSKDDTILKGTVLSNLNEMCVWEKDGIALDNEQLNKMKVSDVEGDTNVAGVFVNWTRDEGCNTDDMNIAMTGDMIIRIAQGTTVNRGDLLMSAGDGTAKPQGDDIVRSKTIAKVTSNYVTCTYADGSYCVPCVLMAC